MEMVFVVLVINAIVRKAMTKKHIVVSIHSNNVTQISNIKVELQEEFEDTKGAIKIHISKKNRQHNGQKKK